MKIRLIGLEEDLKNFESHLNYLDYIGEIDLISTSKTYHSRYNDKEKRLYFDVIVNDKITNKIKVEIYDDDDILFQMYFATKEEAELFMRYFYAHDFENDIRLKEK